MLLTIRTTQSPATDLGFLLHKHPDHVHTREFPFGKRHGLLSGGDRRRLHGGRAARRRSGRNGACRGARRQRAAASRISTSTTVRTSRRRCSRWCCRAGSTRRWAVDASGSPSWSSIELPLEVRLAAVPCRGGEAFLRALFEPLGYEVEASVTSSTRHMPVLGPSRLFTVTLRARCRLSDAADAPLRPHSGARRSEALLGRRRRGREAAASRRRLARTPSGPRCYRLSATSCTSAVWFATPSPG